MNIQIRILSVLFTVLLAIVATNVKAEGELEQLLTQMKNERIKEARANKAREKKFKAVRTDQQAILDKAKNKLRAEIARNKQLIDEIALNKSIIEKKSNELEQLKHPLTGLKKPHLNTNKISGLIDKQQLLELTHLTVKVSSTGESK